MEEEGGFNPDEGEHPPQSDFVTVKTYLPVNSSTDERRNRIDLGVRLVAHVSETSALRERLLDEEEWQNSWKEHFHVLHIGQNVVIAPTWREYVAKDSDKVVTLDPGMAFGTGHHPTTRMCLEQLEALSPTGLDVLDVGCGSGILSIAAAKLGARNVFGLEIDSVAVNVAKQNIRENGVEHTVRIVEGTLPHQEVQPGAYDISIANISAKVIAEFAPHLVGATKPGGLVMASGILLQNKSTVVDALVAAGAVILETFVDTDWVTILAKLP